MSILKFCTKIVKWLRFALINNVVLKQNVTLCGPDYKPGLSSQRIIYTYVVYLRVLAVSHVVDQDKNWS